MSDWSGIPRLVLSRHGSDKRIVTNSPIFSADLADSEPSPVLQEGTDTPDLGISVLIPA